LRADDCTRSRKRRHRGGGGTHHGKR
jgi:hypothetical protein